MWRIMALCVCVALASCTSKPDERLPDEQVMHFPNALALRGSHLAITSSSADGKYSVGRLVVVDTAAIKDAIANDDPHEPVPFKKIVRSNILIPQETGEIYFSENCIATAGRENSELIAITVKDGVALCNDGRVKADACEHASSLVLSDYDPFSLVGVFEDAALENIVASYLSSDRIDVIKFDKSKSKGALQITKSLNALDLVQLKISGDTLKGQRIVTRKIRANTTNDLDAKVYFLLEQHSQKVQTPTKPKAIFLVAIKTSDLLNSAAISEQKIELWNLAELASMAGAQDFFIDDAKQEAYVLSRVPEALYKIDLAKKTLNEVASICTGATSMTVDASDDTIIVPCFAENRLTALSMETLTVKATSKVLGRGPVSVVVDKTSGYIFCSISNDGIVAILDSKLRIVGHLFEKAPLNRIGS